MNARTMIILGLLTFNLFYNRVLCLFTRFCAVFEYFYTRYIIPGINIFVILWFLTRFWRDFAIKMTLYLNKRSFIFVFVMFICACYVCMCVYACILCVLKIACMSVVSCVVWLNTRVFYKSVLNWLKMGIKWEIDISL